MRRALCVPAFEIVSTRCVGHTGQGDFGSILTSSLFDNTTTKYNTKISKNDYKRFEKQFDILKYTLGKEGRDFEHIIEQTMKKTREERFLFI